MTHLCFRMATHAEETQITRLIDMTLSELEEEFGKRIGTLDETKKPFEVAREWIARKHQELHNLVCAEGMYY